MDFCILGFTIYDSRIGISDGVLAQLVERLNGIEEVRGSNPLGSKAASVEPTFISRGHYRITSGSVIP